MNQLNIDTWMMKIEIRSEYILMLVKHVWHLKNLNKEELKDAFMLVYAN